MKAAYIEQPGAADVLRVGELEKPQAGAGQVLVRVTHSTVNPIDTYLRAGMIPARLPSPFIVGCDFAGTVETVGPGVTRFRTGDRVWGSNQGLLGRQGATAEYIATDECWVYSAPEGIADDQLAAIALVGITAHLGLFQKGNLQSGQTVFVNGGSGGVGHVVVQMAHLAGARVITTAGSAEKAESCCRFGADEVILYREESVPERVAQLAPDGVDLWYETQREPDLLANVPLLRAGGRMILMAGRDAKPALPLGNFYTRDCMLIGFAMLNATPEAQRHAAEDIARWMADGRLHAQIATTLPIDRIAEAHQLQEDATIHKKTSLNGKIVIRI